MMTSRLISALLLVCYCTCVFGLSNLWKSAIAPRRNALVEGIMKEISTNAPARQVIVDQIELLIKESVAQKKKFDINSINGDWRSLWTTEKETEVFRKNGFLGSKCIDISQSIDLAGGKINNVIKFENAKKFLVVGSIQVDECIDYRANFKFVSAKLSFGNLDVPLPPVGKGWFDNIYVDSKIRIVKDIRGDYLITERI